VEISSIILIAALITPSAKQEVVDFWRELECRGAISKIIIHGALEQREMLSAFLELRRRGEVPTFDRQWCIEQGFMPFRESEEKQL